MKSFAVMGILVAMAQGTTNSGLRVRGHVSGVPVDAPDGRLSVELTVSGLALTAPIYRDGTFEFTNVPSGRVVVRGAFLPRTNLAQLTLDNKDVDGVELSVQSPQVLGQFVLEDGRPLPTNQNLHAPILKLEARSQKSGTISYQYVRSDGLFALMPTSPDDYNIRVTMVPAGYSVKSVTYAGIDGLRGPLRLATPYSFMRITLTKQPAPAGSGTGPSVAQIVSDAGDSTLIVSQSGRGPAYVEGSLNYFDVRSVGSDGFRQEKRLGGEFCILQIGRCDPSPAANGDSLAFSLPAGTFEIRGYVRPCDGNCGRLGGPADECRATFRIQSGETLYANRIQNQRVCTLAISKDSK